MKLDTVIESITGKTWKGVDQAAAYAAGVLSVAEDIDPVSTVTIQDLNRLMAAIISAKTAA